MSKLYLINNDACGVILFITVNCIIMRCNNKLYDKSMHFNEFEFIVFEFLSLIIPY